MRFLYENHVVKNRAIDQSRNGHAVLGPAIAQLGAGGCSIIPDKMKKPKPLFGGRGKK